MIRKKKVKILLWGFVVIISLFGTYYNKNLFEGIATFLAVPSFVLSIVVLNIIDIKGSDLELYYKRRCEEEEQYEYNKKNCKQYLDEHHVETKNYLKKVDTFIKKLNKQENPNRQIINGCTSNYILVLDYFNQTSGYIFDKSKEISKESRIEKATDSKINLPIFLTEDEINQLKQLLDDLNAAKFSQEGLPLLESLFGSSGLFSKYIRSCDKTYAKMKGQD